MKKSVFILGMLCFLAAPTIGQPLVTGVSAFSTWPGDTLVLTGSGFHADAASNAVWFGPVRGTVVSATTLALRVAVPPQAALAPIEVINLGTGLSARSSGRFMPSFSGTGFATSDFPSAPLVNSADVRVFTSNVNLLNFCSCDFDLDGKPDFIATKSEVLPELLVLRNTSSMGNLSFASSVFNLVTYLADNVACGDLDGDGKPDLLVSRSSNNNSKNLITAYRNTSTPGSIQFGPAVQLTMTESDDVGDVLVIRDLNADGLSDVVVTNLKRDRTLYVFENRSSSGSLSFTANKVTLPGAEEFSTSGLEVEDFDGDGKPDLAVAQSLGDEIYFLRNLSNGALDFDEPVTLSVPGASMNYLVGLDVQGDGRMDLAATDYLSDRLLVFENTGAAGQIGFAAPLGISTTVLPDGLHAGDVNGDGFVDMAIASRGENKLTVMIGNGTTSFSRTDLSLSRKSRNVWIGDLDGDGKPDLSMVSVKNTTEPCSIDMLRNKSCYIPAITNPQPLALCVGQKITLKAVPGVQVGYDWKKDGVLVISSSIPFLEVNQAGTYSVTATGAGCTEAESTSSPFVLTADTETLPPDPQIDGDLTVCSGGTIGLSVPDIAGVTYRWSGPDGFTASTSSIQIPSVLAAKAGPYSVELAKGNCRTKQVEAVVSVVGLDGIRIRSSSITNAACAGGSVTLEVNASDDFTYQWKRAGAAVSGANLPELQTSVSGMHAVVVAFASIPGCSQEVGPVNVRIITPPTASFTMPAKGCAGSDNEFVNTSVTDAGAADLVNHLWNFGGGTPSASNAVQPRPVSYAAPQSSTVTLTVSYSGVLGCADSESKVLQILSAILPDIQPATAAICPDSVLRLTVAGDFQSLNWSQGGAGASIDVEAAGTYAVETVDINGCAGQDEIEVASLERPVLALSATPSTARVGENIQLAAAGAESYLWEDIPGSTDLTSATQSLAAEETRYFRVLGVGANGCGARDSVQLVVSGDSRFPNVFSPNGDGDNDVWQIDGIGAFSQCKLIIFDRNGNTVLSVKGYQNDWDGTWQGKPVPAGTYYWILECPDDPPLTGHILIAR